MVLCAGNKAATTVKKTQERASCTRLTTSEGKNLMAYPQDLKYTKEHEWIRAENGAATVGITDYAQGSLGDIVFVELPKTGAELAQGKSFGTVESVKAVSELYSPASGTVTEVN